MNVNFEPKISNICVAQKDKGGLRNSWLLRSPILYTWGALLLKILTLNLSRPQLIEVPLNELPAHQPMATAVYTRRFFMLPTSMEHSPPEYHVVKGS
jgi:hypothetical protein